MNNCENIRPLSTESKVHNNRKTKKVRYLWATLILVLLIAVSAILIMENRQRNPQILYTAAVADAVTADVGGNRATSGVDKR